jgi:hypothetical protein
MPAASPLPKLWEVPAAIRERLGKEAGPQRAMLEEGHLLVIVNHPPGPNDRARKPALFWRKPDGDWRSNDEGGGISGLHKLAAEYDALLIKLEDEQQGAATAADYHRLLEHTAPVLRSARGLHRALQQARDMVKSDRELIHLRDQAAAIERVAELLLHDAQAGMSFTAARKAEDHAVSARRMAATAHRLNILACVFLPLTALASLFSMGVPLPFQESSATFWVTGLAGLGLGMLLSLLIRRGD